jgi:hypothetical protein
MDTPFDILLESEEGLYLLMASSSNRQYAAIVAESIYYHNQEKRPGRSQARAVIVRDMENPHNPVLMDVWPERWKDFDAWHLAVDRYREQFG